MTGGVSGGVSGGAAVRFADRLRATIARDGPMAIGKWMGRCNFEYYDTREPFGTGGDFVTAPEISQMFGELVGLALADAWARAGSPPAVRLVELGPGRGTLMTDALRATARVPGFHAALTVTFVEMSTRLRTQQRARVPEATWEEDCATVPRDRPVLLIANEFFDALGVDQLEMTAHGWRMRRVRLAGDAFACVADGPVPAWIDTPPPAPPGTVVERQSMREGYLLAIGRLLKAHGGAALIVDYGHCGSPPGDTLQALRHGAFADPFAHPGEADLTAHVDFAALMAMARLDHVATHGPVTQAAWLQALGIRARADALKAAADIPARAAIEAAVQRLTHPAQMGTLFKVLGLTAGGWPTPAGFGD